MNIYGIGTDIVNVKRIGKVLKKNKNLFKKRIFTNSEIKSCEKRKNSIECFAKRFAAKEALFKAVSLNNILKFKDVEVINDKVGAPKFNIKNQSLKKLKKILKHKRFKIHLSLSDDNPWATASVIIYLY